jgi:hypothetical protein
MNSKRKADIQRRLSLASVPKPPEGLADRIKADIPQYLKAAEADRRRHFRSWSLNLRVAASFLILISALFVAIQLMSPEEEMRAMKSVSTATFAPASPALPPRQLVRAAPQDEVRVEIAQEVPEVPATVADTRTANEEGGAVLAFEGSPRPRRDIPTVEEAERAIQSSETGIADGVVGGAAGGSPAADSVAPPVAVAEAAAPAVSAPAPAFPTAPPAAQSARRAAAPAGMTQPLMKEEADAAGLRAESRNTVFGISVDPEVFHHIKNTLEHGQRPSAESVNVGALVNYFAGAPARKPRRNVTLEVEGSPVPVGVEGRRGMVRFTIDTPAAEAANAPTQPVAKDATIAIVINKAAVTSFRPISVDNAAAEDTLAGNTSVTGLYEVELRPGISSRERVATITLRYRSVSDNRYRVVRKELLGRDFGNAWTAASRRHRLASLGAVWGESLKGAASEAEVAQRAEELATQSPEDIRARELSRLAAVSSRMRGTGTGSGR